MLYSFSNLKIITTGFYRGLVVHYYENKMATYYKSTITNDFRRPTIVYKSSDFEMRPVKLKDMLLYQDDSFLWQLNDHHVLHKKIHIPILLKSMNSYIFLSGVLNEKKLLINLFPMSSAMHSKLYKHFDFIKERYVPVIRNYFFQHKNCVVFYGF